MIAKRLAAAAVVAALAGFAAGGASGGYEGQRVLVELFTSQGCSLCPRADRFAGRLLRREDVIVLSYHVSYWDYVGWADPFASPATDRRQYDYARALGQRGVYTPEVVVDGRAHAAGSDIDAVRRLIARRKTERLRAAAAPPRLGMERANGRLWVTVGTAPYRGEADVVLARFDSRRETDVTRGENGGQTLASFNIVRDLLHLGSWRGAAARFPVDEAQRNAALTNDGYAAIVQDKNAGPVIAVAIFPTERLVR